jgi:hypothetical protein
MLQQHVLISVFKKKSHLTDFVKFSQHNKNFKFYILKKSFISILLSKGYQVNRHPRQNDFETW